jgi:hypothetical protein
MVSQKLKQKLYEQKNKAGLVGGTITINEWDEAEHAIAAHITPEGWDIEMNVRKGFEPVTDSRQRAYARVKKIENGLEKVLTNVLGHEIAHWELPYGSERGCPYDVYWHDKILEAVKKGLPKEKEGQADYVANAFEDMIINPRVKEHQGDFSGQVLFWDWQGIETKEQGGETYPKFYEAFVKLNMHLWGDGIDSQLLKRHYADDKEVEKAIKKTVRDLRLPEGIENTAELFNKRQWPIMAETFARNLADLLDDSSKLRLSAFSGQGSGSEGGGQRQPAGNGVEEKVNTREGKEAIAYGRYMGGDEQSPNFTDYENLDSLYRRLARAIPVNIEAITRESNLQIAPLTHRPYDEERDDSRRVKLSKLYVTDQGLRFGVPEHPLTVDAKSKIQRRSFPDFKMVLIDNSRSMASAPDGSNNVGSKKSIPWGDKSKYHYALLGHYGVENFLTQQQIAQYIQHGLSLFSSQMRYKEAGFQGLDEVRRFALNPDWGSTRIDASILRDSLAGRESFVLSISDGAIANWSSARDEVRKLAERNYFAHIQIGGETEFTRDLASWEVPVFYVNSGEDLSRLMVDVTKKTYERFTHGGAS